MDESYRSFAFIAACLTVLHFILPVIVVQPSCSDSVAVVAPSAILVCLGTVYSLGYLVWIKTTSVGDFFSYNTGSDGHGKKTRQSRIRDAEDVRFMTLLWMALGAAGLLSNDLVWATRRLLTASILEDWALVTWTSWIALSGLLAALVTLSLGHLLSLGAEAEIEAAQGMLRRISRLKIKAIKLQ